MSTFKNYYAILGVRPGASPDDVKTAYRKLARRYHPDMEDTADATRFREIQEAYETLMNPERRRAYDLTVGERIPVSFGDAVVPEAWFEPVTSRGAAPRPRFRSGPEIVLSPDEARRGGTLSFEVRVEEDCEACDGTGRGFMIWCWDCRGGGKVTRYRMVSFLIPPGVEHGATLSSPLGPGKDFVRARVLIAQR